MNPDPVESGTLSRLGLDPIPDKIEVQINDQDFISNSGRTLFEKLFLLTGCVKMFYCLSLTCL